MTARLLANENFPAPSVAHLRERGHDVLAIAEVARSLSDVEVLALAVREQRSVLTFDRDYGELVFSRRLPVPPAIFYLRLPSYRPAQPGMLVASLLESKRSFAGLFVIIEPTGLRMRPLPSRDATPLTPLDPRAG